MAHPRIKPMPRKNNASAPICSPEPSRLQVRSIYRATRSRKTLQTKDHLKNLSVSDQKSAVIAGIMCVEMVARPSWIRAIEWTFQFVSNVARLERKLTVGPFQIRNGPWKLSQAVKIAYESFESEGFDEIYAAAAYWNGPRASTANDFGALSYADCLKVAVFLVEQRSFEYNAESCRHPECRIIVMAQKQV